MKNREVAFVEWVSQNVNPLIKEYSQKREFDPVIGLLALMARRLVARGVDPDRVIQVVREHANSQAAVVKNRVCH
jgi:hypothetical protein